jgi:glycosyltransferase involved in cell wall biosynthesis
MGSDRTRDTTRDVSEDVPGDASRVLLVSRPLEPRRADGTVQLVRLLAAAGADLGEPGRWHVCRPAGAAPPAPGVPARVTALPGPWGLRAWQPLTLAWLLGLGRGWIRHYFFTPSRPVVRVLRAVHRLRPGPTVQTFCSTPGDEVDLRPLVFAHRVVALSRHCRDRLLAAGVAASQIRLIPPAVAPAPTRPPAAREALRRRVRRRLGLPPEARLLLYMGDYDVAGAALTVARALPTLLRDHPGRHAVLACRPKGAAHAEVERQVRAALTEGGAPARRVHLAGTVPHAPELAAGADLALLPAPRLPDKMDLPLALLESLAAGVPGVVANRGPLADLVRAGAAAGVDPAAPQRLAWEAERLLADPEAHRAQGEAGRRWCATFGAPATLARAHRALYAELRASSP